MAVRAACIAVILLAVWTDGSCHDKPYPSVDGTDILDARVSVDSTKDPPVAPTNKPAVSGARSSDGHKEESGRSGVESTSTQKTEEEQNVVTTPPSQLVIKEGTGTGLNTKKNKKKTFDNISVKILRGEKDRISAFDLALSKEILYLNYTQMNAYGVDYHYKKRFLFFNALGKIYRDEVVGRLTRTGALKQVAIFGTNNVVSLAVDWVHDKIYWISETHQVVEMANLDGSNRNVLFDSVLNITFPNNIAVDPYRGYLFFVGNNIIYRSTLDGTDLQKIPSFAGRPVRCLALDIDRQRLHYAGKKKDITSGKPYLASSGYDGQEAKDLPLENIWNDIFAIDVFRDTLYFAHYKNGQGDTLWSANLTRPNVKPMLLYSVETPGRGIWSVRVYHPGVQEQPEEELPK